MDDGLLKQLTKTRVDMVKAAGEIARIEATITDLVTTHKNKLEKLRQTDSELQLAIKEAMRNSDVRKYENEVLSITYIAPSVRTILDTGRLKTEKPDLYKEYSKETQVADSIRIKVRDA